MDLNEQLRTAPPGVRELLGVAGLRLYMAAALSWPSSASVSASAAAQPIDAKSSRLAQRLVRLGPAEDREAAPWVSRA